MSKQPTCEERIAAHRESRLDDFRALIALGNNPYEPNESDLETLRTDFGYDVEADDAEGIQEKAYQAISELPLGVSRWEVINILLSTGGPGDWLEVKLYPRDSAGERPEIEGISYHFNDWFDHAEENLTGDDLKTAESFVEALGVLEY